MAQSLDPLNLLRHLEELQQALWRPSSHAWPHLCAAPSVSLVPFCVEGCLPGSFPSQNKRVDPPEKLSPSQGIIDLFDWPRSMKDPFEGVWDVILRGVLAHPDWSGRQLFRELQQLFPGRYQPSQLPTFQQGLRKIGAHLLILMEDPWPQEVLQASVLLIEPPADQQDVASLPPPVSPLSHAQAGAPGGAYPPVIEEANPLQVDVHEPMHPSSTQESQQTPDLQLHHLTMTIEDAIGAYLQEQRKNGRRRKTLQWHQTALGLLQQYLVKERHLCFLAQLTQSEVRGWLTFLRTTASCMGAPRRASTLATYGRSARAFCHWAERNGYLEQTPIIRGILPKGEKKRLEVLERDVFERLSLSCRPGAGSGASVDYIAARNRTLLWIFSETGMRASELCGLRLGDVDYEQRRLRIGEQGHERWLTLSPDGWYQLLSYLEQYRLKAGVRGKGQDEEMPLFLSETYQPLTSNALTLVFHRLSKRTGITQRITPSLLRDNFAIQYLQAGGEPATLRDLLGLKDRAALHRYERFLAQRMEPQEQKEPREEHVSRSITAPQPHKRRRRRASSTVPRTHQ